MAWQEGKLPVLLQFNLITGTIVLALSPHRYLFREGEEMRKWKSFSKREVLNGGTKNSWLGQNLG